MLLKLAIIGATLWGSAFLLAFWHDWWHGPNLIWLVGLVAAVGSSLLGMSIGLGIIYPLVIRLRQSHD